MIIAAVNQIIIFILMEILFTAHHFSLKNIAGSPDGMYQLRLKIIVHLFSQISYIYVDGVGASFVVEVPEIVLSCPWWRTRLCFS